MGAVIQLDLNAHHMPPLDERYVPLTEAKALDVNLQVNMKTAVVSIQYCTKIWYGPEVFLRTHALKRVLIRVFW